MPSLANNTTRTTQISIATSTKKNIPTYNLKITVTPAADAKKSAPQTIELARSFTAWFDVQGRFVPLPFQTMLATSVPAIGRADPKRAAGSGNQEGSDLLSADSATLDALLASSSETATTGADAAAGTGSGKKAKPRKKA